MRVAAGIFSFWQGAGEAPKRTLPQRGFRPDGPGLRWAHWG